jgi:hypothetical protein
MAAYGNQDAARAGLVYGSNNSNVETLIAASGVTFEFGEAVMVDTGVEDVGYAPDSTDASLKFAGIAIISQRSYTDSEGNYPPYSLLNVLSEGMVYVQTASGISASTANQAAYVCDDKGSATNYQKFTTDSSAGNIYDIGCYFRSNVDGGLALLEVRGLK